MMRWHQIAVFHSPIHRHYLHLMTTSSSPEIGRSIVANGLRTNYHDVGKGFPVFLIHGSGPGVSAFANWRLLMPKLAATRRVIAPDMAGFGYTDRPEGASYSMENWVAQALGLMDALELPQADFVGNSFGGALSLALAIRHPERVRRLVLMGSAGVNFKLTEGLDIVWGYKPSLEAMQNLLDVKAFDPCLLSIERSSSYLSGSIAYLYIRRHSDVV